MNDLNPDFILTENRGHQLIYHEADLNRPQTPKIVTRTVLIEVKHEYEYSSKCKLEILPVPNTQSVTATHTKV